VIAKAASDSVDFVVTESSTTDSLLFTVPSSQAGVLGISVNGATNYMLGMSIYSQTLGAAVDWKNYQFGHVKACMEMVPIGAEPQFCAPIAEEATYAVNPSSFYAATRSGSVGGYLNAQDNGKLSFSSVSSYDVRSLIPSLRPTGLSHGSVTLGQITIDSTWFTPKLATDTSRSEPHKPSAVRGELHG
jgi:hypothetical protein